MRLKIDLHVHTSYSDGSGSVKEVIRVAERKGLDGLAITDHNMLDGYFEAKSYSSRLIILPGYEVSTDAGHMLVIGLEEYLPPSIKSSGMALYSKVVDWVRLNGGLSILAHPATERFKMDKWMRNKPDAVEVLNSLYPLNYFVRRGLRLSSALGVASVGGSDAHKPADVGNAYTIVDLNGSSIEDGVKKAIKAGRSLYGGSLSPAATRLRVGIGFLLSTLIQSIT
ncbi:MAG: CehA/McbA family metallohydrolase [Candidatus Bathyarchaeia archaeon]